MIDNQEIRIHDFNIIPDHKNHFNLPACLSAATGWTRLSCVSS
jgi:hypothetical protein